MGTVRISEHTHRKLEQLREELPGSPPLSRLADEAIERYEAMIEEWDDGWDPPEEGEEGEENGGDRG